MRGDIPASMTNALRSGDFTGLNRPVTRVTIQRPQMRLTTLPLKTTFRRVPMATTDDGAFNPYPTGINPDKGERISTTYANYLFMETSPFVLTKQSRSFTQPTSPAFPSEAPVSERPLEFPNIQSVQTDRSLDSDVGSLTLRMWNVRPRAIGDIPSRDELSRSVGFFARSFGRPPVAAISSPQWGSIPASRWAELLVPDNIVRTYQGYGSDLLDHPDKTVLEVPPERDSKLVLTGVWHIDSVQITGSEITVQARDVGRLMLDHMVMPPVVPNDFYPPTFEGWGDDVTTQEKVTVDTRRRSRIPFRLVSDGNSRWPESAYLGAARHGHDLKYAADGKTSTYWLSVGNGNPAWRSSYEYIEMAVKKMTVDTVKVHTKGTGYTAYVSVKANGEWVTGKVMPYHRDGRGRYEEGIPYVARKDLGGKEGPHLIKFPKPIKNVTLVRLWLGNLPAFQYAGARYRAAIREVDLLGEVGSVKKKVKTKKRSLTPGPAGSNPGRVEDLTDIVKLFCAWGGFYWPKVAFVAHADGATRRIRYRKSDSATLGAGAGRVWGDFQQTGTAPKVQILASNFDKRSLMDCINYMREMTGFIFFVDETGGVQWRQPNIWEKGNWVTLGSNPRRTELVPEVSEDRSILNLSATISSRNVREAIFAGDIVGKNAVMVGGFNPNPTGLRRVAGWTDQNFGGKDEARVAADLIATRQLFRYRVDAVTIPANPELQIDDQVRLVETASAEGFVHYIKGISTNFDAKSGRWDQTLQTHWLGDNPAGRWAVTKTVLASTTAAYVDSLEERGITWSRAGQGV